MNKIRHIAATVLIIIGSFLEIYFYVWRFSQDGLKIWLSIIIGSGLTMLLIIMVYIRKFKITYLIIIPLALYSIFATSAGQAFSLNEEIKVTQQKNITSEHTNEEIKETKESILWYNKEIDDMATAIKEQGPGLEGRGSWGKTRRETEVRQDQFIAKRDELKERLSELRTSATTHENIETRPENIYTFYADMLNSSKYWLQFFLQTALSLFIAIMSPVGLILFTQRGFPESGQKYFRKRRENISGITKEEIIQWVNFNWIGIRSKKSKFIIPEAHYVSYLKKTGLTFDKKVYDAIIDKTKRLQIIAEDSRIIEKREKVAITKLIKAFKVK